MLRRHRVCLLYVLALPVAAAVLAVAADRNGRLGHVRMLAAATASASSSAAAPVTATAAAAAANHGGVPAAPGPDIHGAVYLLANLPICAVRGYDTINNDALSRVCDWSRPGERLIRHPKHTGLRSKGRHARRPHLNSPLNPREGVGARLRCTTTVAFLMLS